MELQYLHQRRQIGVRSLRLLNRIGDLRARQASVGLHPLIAAKDLT